MLLRESYILEVKLLLLSSKVCPFTLLWKIFKINDVMILKKKLPFPFL